MTYLALARKWRPRSFADVAGQQHVVRALENALNSGRVHHAFLFTGTRGVGKTTIARILVKALNCEQGVSAVPCGVCASCVAIDAGRFVDFLELDAASRTGVDDTRELLDNAQYTPAAGRFKVYLIDEVHMLSKSAFNALLKTLEEPPPHVKFLLATTDPQKIPVTVLSRCLQFNLKRLSRTVIAGRVEHICASENIVAEKGAIARLAEAANGSLRDSLSLLDQALAYGNGTLSDAETAEMLGSMDRGRVLGLLKALAAGDAAGLLAQVRELDELAPDYDDVLGRLATQLQRIALLQIAGPDALDDDDDHDALAELGSGLSPELVQLMYQIAVNGRRDLQLAPDPRTGFEMTLLRVLAFRPEVEPLPVQQPGGASVASATKSPKARRAELQPASHDAPIPASVGDDESWPAIVNRLALDGAARQLAAHTALLSRSPFDLQLAIERRNAHLLTDNLKARVTAAVQDLLDPALKVTFTVQDEPVADDGEATVAGREARAEEAAQEHARRTIEQDSNIRQLGELLGAEIVPDSVRPVRGSRPTGR